MTSCCCQYKSDKLLLSESHSHSLRRQPQSPDPSHLSSDHLHLLSHQHSYKLHNSLTLIVRSTVNYTDPCQTPYTLTCVCVLPRLSCDSPKDIPGLQRCHRSSSVDPCSPEHPDTTLLWTRRISVPALCTCILPSPRYSPAHHSPISLHLT